MDAQKVYREIRLDFSFKTRGKKNNNEKKMRKKQPPGTRRKYQKRIGTAQIGAGKMKQTRGAHTDKHNTKTRGTTRKGG